MTVQVVILAGGFGTRLAEETDVIPKPMVLIGNIPILTHIMNYYSRFGHTDFIIALGYKGEFILEYFKNSNPDQINPDWKVKLEDTGLNTSTGGRIKILENLLDEEFMLTYGDGLSNVNLDQLIKHHVKEKKIATVTAVRPPARFGTLSIRGSRVTKFNEKDPQETGWINGGFFCLNRKVCEYITDSTTSFESEPVNQLVSIRQLSAFKHDGWWHPMDTLRDKRVLEDLWSQGNAPWAH